MKIQYASDLHLEFSDNWSYLKHNPLQILGDILILAGDIGYLGDDNYSKHPFWDWASDNYLQVIIALGNHEFYKYYDIATLPDGFCGEIRHNVHYYYNTVVQLPDVDIIVSTLWAHIELENACYTETCVSDFKRIRWGDSLLTFAEFNKEHRRCFEFIQKTVSSSCAKTKIVVTHHVPSFQMLSPEFIGSRANGAFTVELSEYIENSGIDYWIYGHSHRNIDATIGKTKCVCNQLGYVFANEHTSFAGDKMIVVG
ncbi:metallophosphoesterase [Bacteroides sp.]|uniref:metallophosphoesterase n=1 Tax=Bacteroides sp. TaxID=29523 RepID=UPI003D115A17